MSVTSVSVRKGRKISREIRDQIVLEHLSLVKAIAIRVHENLPVHVDLDDMVHAGVLGLFDAVEKYDNNRNVVFQAYAKHRIKGAILDSLRQLDWASRDVRKRQKEVDAVTRDLATELGRNPTEGEMADRMGVTLERWRRMVAEMATVGPVPSAETELQRSRDFTSGRELEPDNVCDRRQLQLTLARAASTLPERYQKVVFLYYTNEMTMKEIAEVMGVNESRVSQIHKTALRKMAVALKSEGIESAEAFACR
jgi:RNA polymerase sigma factor for flagellar operon FliA